MSENMEQRLCAIERALYQIIKTPKETSSKNEQLVNEVKNILSSKLLIPNKEHLDVSEACFYLGISKSTLYKMNHRKLIPYMKTNGKKVYYLKSDLDDYIRKYKITSMEQISSQVNRRGYAA